MKITFKFLIAFIVITVILFTLSAGFLLYSLFYETSAQHIRMATIPCSELLPQQEVEQIIAANNETLKQIEQVGGGWVNINPIERCGDKAVVSIYHGTEQGKYKIMELIGETFFGIPVFYYNV